MTRKVVSGTDVVFGLVAILVHPTAQPPCPQPRKRVRVSEGIFDRYRPRAGYENLEIHIECFRCCAKLVGCRLIKGEIVEGSLFSEVCRSLFQGNRSPFGLTMVFSSVGDGLTMRASEALEAGWTSAPGRICTREAWAVQHTLTCRTWSGHCGIRPSPRPASGLLEDRFR